MKNLLALILILSIPALTKAQTLWSCEAKSFHANPFFGGNQGVSGRLEIEAGATKITLTQSETGKLLADLAMDNPEVPAQSGIDITTNLISSETIGADSYQTALSYIAEMLDRPDLLESSSYKSYQLMLGENQFSLVVLELMKGDELSARAVLFPGYEVMGACL